MRKVLTLLACLGVVACASTQPKSAPTEASVQCVYASATYSPGYRLETKMKDGTTVFQTCQADGTWKEIK